MRSVVSRLSKSTIRWKRRVVLQELLGQLISLLKTNTPHDSHCWWELIGNDDISTFIKGSKEAKAVVFHLLPANWLSELKKQEHFKNLIMKWQQDCSEGVFDLEFATEIINNISQDTKLISCQEEMGPELSKGVSLFLAILSETQKNDFYPMQEAYNEFTKFFNWLNRFIAKCGNKTKCGSIEQQFCSRVVCRYFVFEFWRQYPEQSSNLLRAYPWNSALLESIWHINREKMKTIKAIFNQYLTGLQACHTLARNRTAVSGQRIPIKQFRLFCKLRSLTTPSHWTTGHLARWEEILFGDKILENPDFLETPELLRSSCSDPGTTQWVRDRFASFEIHERKLISLPGWKYVWPEILTTLRPQNYQSKEWLLILAIASVSWEITGPKNCKIWEGAAEKHRSFWNWLLSIEKKTLRTDSPIIGRAAIRYAVLQILVNFPSYKFKNCNTEGLLEHMWKCTAQLCTYHHSGNVGPVDTVTREEFQSLTQTELSFFKSNKSGLLENIQPLGVSTIFDCQSLALTASKKLSLFQKELQPKNESPTESTSTQRWLGTAAPSETTSKSRSLNSSKSRSILKKNISDCKLLELMASKKALLSKEAPQQKNESPFGSTAALYSNKELTVPAIGKRSKKRSLKRKLEPRTEFESTLKLQPELGPTAPKKKSSPIQENRAAVAEFLNPFSADPFLNCWDGDDLAPINEPLPENRFAAELNILPQDDFVSAEFLKWLHPMDDVVNQFGHFAEHE
eukprot:Gregarina_sp_Poly_1__8128@NODE_469_length_8155_cov_116_696093_g381_i0_p2_GENE_NODE_469_length_8155_cov_116_696093_g381_i0NODE_469_length_8155_cov_116_696093_g381_i0_p2_ORF_typecomplete_len740_score104_16S_100/PF01023_19/8_4e03S_100/PF01023_19/2_7e02S_100/PF01023_19/0_61S_100/PF01023_19/7_1e03_NODE_469_length_8155_cov_116_696093_g381_i01322351